MTDYKSTIEMTEEEFINRFKDDPNSSWLFAVPDKYKPMSQEEIRNELDSRRASLGVLMMHSTGDFNISSVMRSCNGFNLKEFHYFGKKKYDKRGAISAYKYINVIFHSDFNEIIELKKTYRFVALENNIKYSPVNLVDYTWASDKPSLIIVGEESRGLGDEILELCDDFVEIPMFGASRSFNVSVAASICMYDYISKQNRK